MRWRYGCLLLLLCGGVGYGRDITLTGKVIGPSGEVMAGCRVVAMGSPRLSPPVAVEGMTDAGGAFSMTLAGIQDCSWCQIVAVSSGHCLAWSRQGDLRPLTLRLDRQPMTCGGLITTVSGEPVAGAEVSLDSLEREHDRHWSQYRENLRCWTGNVVSAKADAQGRFALGNLPPGSCAVVHVAAPGFEKLTRQIVAGDTNVHVYLHPEARVSGRVLSEGKPVGGARVYTGDRWKAVTTAADGAFTLIGLSAGKHTLQAAAKGLAGVEVVRVGAGEHREGVVVELQRSATVKGKMVDGKTRAVVPNSLVLGWYAVQYGSASWAVTAADGTYALEGLLPGRLEVTVPNSDTPPLVTTPRKNLKLTVKAGETLMAPDLLVDTHKVVRGRVMTPENVPAAGVEVGTLARSEFNTASSAFFEMQTGAEGEFSLAALQLPHMAPPWVIARDTQHDLAAAVCVEDTAQEVTVALQPGAWLLTKVTTPEGQPVAGWPVELLVGNTRQYARPVPGGVSDASGEVKLGPLPPGVAIKVRLGEHLAHLLANKQEFDDFEFALKPGERRQIEPLKVVPHARTLRGWVSDDRQRPLAGALVYGPRATRVAVTDVQGRFELTGLPLRGKVTVVAAHPTEPLFAGTNVDPDWGQEPGLVLAPPGSMTVKVKRPDGTLAGTVVGVVNGGGGWLELSDELWERLASYGYSQKWNPDGQGMIRAEGLIAGLAHTFVLWDTDDKLKARQESFVAEAGKTVDLGEITMEAQ